MDATKSQFKKYLVDEIKSKSFAKICDIYNQVDEYSKTPEFLDACEKWKKITLIKKKKTKGVRHISEIL